MGVGSACVGRSPEPTLTAARVRCPGTWDGAEFGQRRVMLGSCPERRVARVERAALPVLLPRPPPPLLFKEALTRQLRCLLGWRISLGHKASWEVWLLPWLGSCYFLLTGFFVLAN